MSNSFTMVGKLSIAGDRTNKLAFSDKLLDSGCNIRELNLQMKCDKDNFNLQIKSFMNNAKRNADGTLNIDNSTIYTILNKDGKYESVNFKYKDKEKYEDKVANFRRLVFIDGEERMEFTNEFDYAMFVHTMLKSEDYKDKIFRVQGTIEFSNYKNPKTGVENTYTNYNVERIYVVDNDSEQKATANMEMYITKDCIDDSRLEEENTFNLMGYIPQYLSKKKGDFGYYKMFEYPLNAEGDKAKKKYELIKRVLLDNFEDNELCKIGFKVNLIRRREEVPFDFDKCTDEEKDLVEYGLMELKDLEMQYGAGMGELKDCIQVSSIARGYSTGATPTNLTLVELLNNGEEEKAKPILNDDLTSDEDGDLNIFDTEEGDDFSFDF